MKIAFLILFTISVFALFGQENDLDRINNKVDLIELDSTPVVIEFDWVELTGITTDGGGVLKIWQNDSHQISKIVEEIGLSYGRIKTTIYLEDKMPIKIIETEENFEKLSDGLNYSKLEEVFEAIIYVTDWKNDTSEILRQGKRFYTEETYSIFDYKIVIERAEKAAKIYK